MTDTLIDQLTSREAIRFIGTVGDVLTSVIPIMLAIVDEFRKKEVYSSSELERLIQDVVRKRANKPCTSAVARHSIEVVAALDVIGALPQASARNKRYTLGDNGRVVRAMTSHPKWNDSMSALLFRRPMFEYNGDYLLQALQAISDHRSTELALASFTSSVKLLGNAKLNELPHRKLGWAWEIYTNEVRSRQVTDTPDPDQSIPTKPTIDSLRRARAVANRLYSTATAGKEADSSQVESKTFLHHFMRCRSWLGEIKLVTKRGADSQVSSDGERVLAYFQAQSRRGPPLRIPPSAALLTDAFRLSPDEIEQNWGAIVDDAYWENGLYRLDEFGTYHPHPAEFRDVVDWAFSKTKYPQISEAPLNPLRQAVFLAFLWNQKPLRPAQLSRMLQELWTERADIYGLGLNRQGRPAFVFRKQRLLG